MTAARVVVSVFAFGYDAASVAVAVSALTGSVAAAASAFAEFIALTEYAYSGYEVETND